MTRILREFKKQQIIHQLEQQDIDQQQYARESSMSVGQNSSLKKQSQSPAFGRKSEARSSKSEATTFNKANLKKQSQFMPDMMGATPFMANGYGDFSAAGRAENKANLYPDQSPFDALSPAELLRKSHNIPAPATG
jgi:hypothetical protein